MAPYERFQAWRNCHNLALAIFRATQSWPKSELFGLTAQLKRAALSAPNNIVEGSSRLGAKEFRRYLGISLASLSEAGYLLRFAHELDILPDKEWIELERMRAQASKLTWLLLKSLNRPSFSTAGT